MLPGQLKYDSIIGPLVLGDWFDSWQVYIMLGHATLFRLNIWFFGGNVTLVFIELWWYYVFVRQCLCDKSLVLDF